MADSRGNVLLGPSPDRNAPVVPSSEPASIAASRQANGVVSGNGGVSLVDLGDGIGCFELHAKMNILGTEINTFLAEQLEQESDAIRRFDAFVIATDAPNFSVGANLKEVLAAAQDQSWEELRQFVRRFQAMTRAVKLCSKPVVAAPLGLCLGGGCELMLHAARRQAHGELHAGLVESRIGLIPTGGGCKEMVLRAAAHVVASGSNDPSGSAAAMRATRIAWETVTMATMSSSASEARELDLLDEADGITADRSRLLHEAKAKARNLASAGYAAPMQHTDIAAPGTGAFAELELAISQKLQAGSISKHDALIATHLARIVTGGEVAPGTPLREQDLLDLEQEAFLSLCGESKTLDRIRFTLETGKPLRN